jgi:hypothetical protein
MDRPVTRVRRFSRSKEPVLEPIPEEPVGQPTGEEGRGNEEDPFASLKGPDDEEIVHVKPSRSRKKAPKTAEPVPLLPPPAPLDDFPIPLPTRPSPPSFRDEDIFAPRTTPLFGKERREVLQKIKEFRALFPDELKGFKCSPKASLEELKGLLEEMETVVSVGSVTKICDEAVLMAVQAMEHVTSRSHYLDISGCSQTLRSNPEFARICKVIWVKHRLLTQAPPELQLVLIVGSQALVCAQLNRKKRKNWGRCLTGPHEIAAMTYDSASETHAP